MIKNGSDDNQKQGPSKYQKKTVHLIFLGVQMFMGKTAGSRYLHIVFVISSFRPPL